MRLTLRDPRTRAVLLVLVILLLAAVSIHLVGMADHPVGMALGACLAVVAAIAQVFPVWQLPLRPVAAAAVPVDRVPLAIPVGRSPRPPPGEGTIQRS
jgi:hypothetical protein